MTTQPPTQQEPYLSASLWLVMMKAHQAIREHDARSIESSGLGFSDFATLEVLLHKGPMPVNVIGEKVLLTSGSITTAVDRLERRKLVERHASETDRRLRVVHLTPQGRQLIESVFEKHIAALEKATNGLTAAEKNELIGLLKKLGKHAKAHL